jgi:hypothetical protein
MPYDFTKLTERKRKFCEEYVVTLSRKNAAIAAGYSEGGASIAGLRNLQDENCQDYIDYLTEARAQRLHISQDEVLQKLWAIASADVNELVEYRRVCCRYCYGKDYMYQWTDAEFERAKIEAKNRGYPKPEGPGGHGYDATKPPVAACPECHGEGKGHIHAHDTRNASAQARALYDGAKVGRDGLEIKTLDRMKALELVGKHLGLFKEKVEHSGKIENTGPVLNLTLTSPDAPKVAAKDPDED